MAVIINFNNIPIHIPQQLHKKLMSLYKTASDNAITDYISNPFSLLICRQAQKNVTSATELLKHSIVLPSILLYINSMASYSIENGRSPTLQKCILEFSNLNESKTMYIFKP
jgi:hypothetical protein